MTNPNNLLPKISNASNRRRLAVNFFGVSMILCFVLGCSISQFEFGKKTKTGSSNSGQKTKQTNRSSNDATRSEDEDDLTENLTRLTTELRTANYKNDKAAMKRILDEDFTVNLNGETINKQQLISGSEADKDYISTSVEDSRITVDEGSRAILDFTIIHEFANKTITEKCRDEFVKKGTWQLKTMMPCSSQNVVEK